MDSSVSGSAGPCVSLGPNKVEMRLAIAAQTWVAAGVHSLLGVAVPAEAEEREPTIAVMQSTLILKSTCQT